MKARHLMLVLALGLAAPAMAAEPHDHSHGPKHGGMHVAHKGLDFELVIKPGSIRLYVSDHDKPIDYAKATAKLTLLVGTDQRKIELKPAGDRFEGEGNFALPPGTKAVAQVTFNGRTSTARFAFK